MRERPRAVKRTVIRTVNRGVINVVQYPNGDAEIETWDGVRGCTATFLTDRSVAKLIAALTSVQSARKARRVRRGC